MSNNNITPGTVAEIITTSGVRTGIITNVRSSDEVYGYIVKPQFGHHHEIVDTWKGTMDDILDSIPDERAVVIAREESGVVIFKEYDDLTVHIMGWEEGRRRVNSGGPSKERIIRALTQLRSMNSQDENEEMVRVMDRFLDDEKLREQIRVRLQLA